jgi:hypothetical protein
MQSARAVPTSIEPITRITINVSVGRIVPLHLYYILTV